MYSNERESGISILDLIVKIIFFILFVLVMLWLFPKVPNMKPFYSNVFRENIKYMQDAGESYFTDDKMPKEIGDVTKISLAEMEANNLVLPFVDQDGKACNKEESYVSITKNKDESYSLKTNLVCDTESDYVVKVLGCHTYCKGDNCAKTCTKEQIVLYQYKKATTSTITTYSCPGGYKRDGKNCYKTVLKDTKPAAVVTVTDVTLKSAPMKTFVPATKVEIDVDKTKNPDTSNKVIDTVIKTPNPETSVKVNDKVNVVTTPSTTKKVSYACSGTPSCQTTCAPTYSCNCTSTSYHGVMTTVCSTCGGGCSESCTPTTTTCYRDEVVAGTTTYSCPSQSKYQSGSGTTLSCWHLETTSDGYTYSCPSQSKYQSGSGTTLSCWHFETVDNGYTYKCPERATSQTGSNETLRCYIDTPSKTTYECVDKTYTLSTEDNMCYKTIHGTSTEYKCSGDYTIDGTVCKLFDADKISATAKKSKKTTYSYKWSESTSLSGWTKTGKTKIEEGKEICE